MRGANWLKRSLAVLLFAASSAHATISATATGTTYFSGVGSVSSFTLNRPSVVAVGDLLMVQIALDLVSNTTLTTVTPPSGWAQVSSDLKTININSHIQQAIFSRVATAADTAGGSTSWSLSRSTTAAASMTAFRSSTGIAPTVGASPAFNTTSSPVTGITCPALSGSSGQTILRLASKTQNPGNMASGSSPALTAAVSSITSPWNLYVGYRAFTSAGDTINSLSTVGYHMVHGVLLSESSSVDHYELTYATTGLTCEAQTITIKACADSGCSSLAASSSTVTLGATSGTLSATTVTFTGSTTVTLRQNTPATATLSVSSANPSATNSITCNASSTCSLTFSDAGFSFDVPNLTANKPSGAVTLRAVKNAGDASNSCVALLQNSTQTVKFWSSYISPASGSTALEIHAGSGGSTYSSVSSSSGSPTALTLTFDGNGATTFETRYKDAGQMTLNASYTGSGTYAGVTLTGSDSFVSAPVGLCLQSTTPNLGKASYTACNTNYETCDRFVAAGSPFNFSISARAWESDTDTDFCTSNSITQNYVQTGIPVTPALVAPASGTVASFNHSTIDITSGGSVTFNDATLSEVGVFTLTVKPPTYFGQTINPATSINYGRFFPHHFSLSNTSLLNRATSCVPQPTPAPAFNYLGERFDLSFTITAQNASNQTTQNYQGTFEKLQSFSDLSVKAVSPAIGTTRNVFLGDSNSNNSRLTLFDAINNPMTMTWTTGVGTFKLPLTLARTSSVESPYSSIALGIAPTDSDSVALNSFDLDTSTNALTPSIDHAQIGGATEFRYGRLRLNSASGPSDKDLSIPAYAEYWNSKAFVTSEPNLTPARASDSCTTINGKKATFTPALGATATDGDILPLSNGQSFTALIMKAPGAGYYGNVGVTLDLTSAFNKFPWLQFDWNGDGTLDATATATASFGTYRGSDRVIYWQETQ